MAIIWKIIYWLGFQPQIFNCAYCSEKLKKQKFYRMILPSGIICENCVRKVRIISHQQKISQELVKILRFYNQREINSAAKIKIALSHYQELYQLTIVAIGNILGKRVDL